MGEIKKVKLSQTDKKFAGVCGGFADYLEVDVTILRLLYVVITVMTGFVFGIFFYLLCMLIIPKE